MTQESTIVRSHLECPSCGVHASLAVYDDGHCYCHACGYHQQSYDGESPSEGASPGSHRERKPVPEELQELIDSSSIQNIGNRGLTQATCRHWDYRVRINSRGEGEHIAVVRDEHGVPIGAKVRNLGADGKGKSFRIVGQIADTLYGEHLLGNGGKQLIVAGGEIDVLTVSQLWGCKFPVVGPTTGEGSFKKLLASKLDKINRFEKVVFCLDMDEVGRKANEECARMLPPGKAYIAVLPFKDPNEMHLAGQDAQLTQALMNAPSYRPDGILDADEVDHELDQPVRWGSPYAFDFLTEWTYGYRPGEINVLGAGTGVGKSDWEAEEVANSIRPPEDGGAFVPTALFNYEASALVSLRGVLGKLWSRRFHIPNPKDGTANLYWSQDDLNAARVYRRDRCAKLFINDAKGAADWDAVKDRLRYLAHAFGVKRAFVDPVAALVAAEDDDRKALDRFFAEAKSLAEELDIHITFVSHLTRPSEGKSHEEGGRVTLKQFRGSNAIGMWASFVFGLERDQQAEEEEDRQTTFRCLKDRYTGDSTGKTQTLSYNVMTGRLHVANSVSGGELLPASVPEVPTDLASYMGDQQ